MELINVLIVDDEPHCIEILQTMLEDFPVFEVHSAFSPQKAVEIANQMRIDMLITDLNMPVMGGIPLIDEIRRVWPSCLIIILTAYPDFSTAKEAISRQVFEYVTKLNMRTELPAVLNRAVAAVNERISAQVIQPDDVVRFSREAFLCLLKVKALSEDEKKRLLSLLGFRENEGTRFVLLSGSIPLPEGMLNSLIAENGGSNLIASVSQNDENGLSVVLMQISGGVANTWLFSVLETVQERLRANGHNVSMIVSLIRDLDVPASYHEIGQSLLNRKTDRQDVILVIDSDLAPVIRASDDSNELLTRKIIRYVDAHITEDVSLTCLSGVLGYSRAYISTVFHEKTGLQLQQYVIGQKLAYIKSLMKNKTLSLNSIAEMSGFDSISYFSRFVKRETGMTPREYRLHHETDV